MPAAIGAFTPQMKVICISGDGSIMMNIQELAILGGNNTQLIYLLNNKGYPIRKPRITIFRYLIGCGVESGLPFPDFGKLCDGFGIAYFRSDTESNNSGNS